MRPEPFHHPPHGPHLRVARVLGDRLAPRSFTSPRGPPRSTRSPGSGALLPHRAAVARKPGRHRAGSIPSGCGRAPPVAPVQKRCPDRGRKDCMWPRGRVGAGTRRQIWRVLPRPGAGDGAEGVGGAGGWDPPARGPRAATTQGRRARSGWRVDARRDPATGTGAGKRSKRSRGGGDVSGRHRGGQQQPSVPRPERGSARQPSVQVGEGRAWSAPSRQKAAGAHPANTVPTRRTPRRGWAWDGANDSARKGAA